jgi:rubredoxin
VLGFASDASGVLATCDTKDPAVKTYMCLICGFIYDEAKGRPEEGIPPGTKWADIPLSWRCPDCGSGKEDFEMVEV